MADPLHVVVETPEFIARAEKTMTEEERLSLIDHLAENPTAGEIMKGTGGARKLRWAGRGKARAAESERLRITRGRIFQSFCLPCSGKDRKRT